MIRPKLLLTIIFLIIGISNIYSIGFYLYYHSIEEINDKYLTCLFITKFKNDTFNLNINNHIFICNQAKIEGRETYYYRPQFIECKSKDTVLYIFVDEIDKITTDSIFTTIKIFQRNENGRFKKKIILENYGIPKNILLGLFVTASRKDRNRFYIAYSSAIIIALILGMILA